jgi:hypothetical protein
MPNIIYRIRRSDGAIVAGPYNAVDSMTFRYDFPLAGTYTYYLEQMRDGATSDTIEEAALSALVIKR